MYNDKVYEKFMEENAGYGYLRVRVSSASDAIPIKDAYIKIIKDIDGEDVIFYEGVTDESGMTPKIKLPTPFLDENNLVKPNMVTYKLEAKYKSFSNIYNVNLYEGVCVIQNIDIPSYYGEISD